MVFKKFSGLQLFVGLVLAAVVTVAAVGLYLAGSPSRERDRRFDEQRINALQQVSSALQVYFDRNKTLPPTLEELKAKPDYYLPALQDPKTGQPYEYKVTGTGTYELCATFDLPTAQNSDSRAPKPVYAPSGGGPGVDFWNHAAGGVCFSFNLSKPAGGNCVLMKHQTSGRVGCFGCTNRICTDPSPGYAVYNAPYQKDYLGIPYRCFESLEGCALAQ